MVLNTEQRESFDVAARPLIKWLCENCHPHVIAIVEPTRVELTEGVYFTLIKNYVKD
jgi:hypothetical protein